MVSESAVLVQAGFLKTVLLGLRLLEDFIIWLWNIAERGWNRISELPHLVHRWIPVVDGVGVGWGNMSERHLIWQSC